jgi:hypothetical protein
LLLQVIGVKFPFTLESQFLLVGPVDSCNSTFILQLLLTLLFLNLSVMFQ